VTTPVPGLPVLAWIGLGGNVGDAIATLRAALVELDALPHTALLRGSKLYRTPAWGLVEQPDCVERAFGRERRERWGPRVLDLDLLLYGDAVIDEPGLRVPHPHLHERAFALLPLLEIDPEASIPGRGAARDALAALAYEGIEAVG